MPSGSRPGEKKGGRRKGTQNKRTVMFRSMAESAVAAGVTPLEVMLETMRNVWAEATAQEPHDPVLALQAVAIAEKAAPYCHPKLSAVNVAASVSAPDSGSRPDYSLLSETEMLQLRSLMLKAQAPTILTQVVKEGGAVPGDPIAGQSAAYSVSKRITLASCPQANAPLEARLPR